MSSHAFAPRQWGLILGGSSGFGLATARKLAGHGLNLCVVHRDRRGSMDRVRSEFEWIRDQGVELLTFNTDALDDDNRAEVLETLEEAVTAEGRVRLLLHSIAFGNLKLIASEAGADGGEGAAERLARELEIDPERVAEAADRLFREEEVDGLAALASPPDYPEGRYLEDEDMARTIYAMGTSLLTWTRAVQSRGLFGEDARVLGLTSEGNEVAWKGYAAVSAAKAVLEAVSRSIAVEMAPHGIRSNVVQAGVTETDALRVIPGSDQLKAQARRRNPSGRLTRTEDVANAIYLLALPEARWINGARIRVDGGEKISGPVR